MGSMKPDWRDVAAKRRHEIERKIPQEWLVSKNLLETQPAMKLPYISGILTPWEQQVTEMRAVDILAGIRGRTFTSVEVTRAFCKRAAIAHQAVSICMAWAREIHSDPILSKRHGL